jgi:L-alanine-DL-glutamate epimerase-like enolase superfamily enzyme
LRRLLAGDERWPLADAFVIARGAKTEAHVVTATLEDGVTRGRGEATPYPRYGETPAAVLEAVKSLSSYLQAGGDRAGLAARLDAGAARNALDCALWDFEAKAAGRPVWALAGLEPPSPAVTAFTISLGPPEVMATAAARAAVREMPLLKLKIGGADDVDRVAAVRAAAPAQALVVDANEALDFDALRRLAPDLAALGVTLIEQPLPAQEDEQLEGYVCPVLLCADESVHTRRELAACARRYGAVNIKLDKTGGLTEALALKAQAQAMGLKIMAGCMVATSLAMAPALLIAQGAAVVDLDGPLLLAKDRRPGLRFDGARVYPPEPDLWG